MREISWTNNMLIFSRCKTVEKKEFSLRLLKQDNYSNREHPQQISANLQNQQKGVPNEKHFQNQPMWKIPHCSVLPIPQYKSIACPMVTDQFSLRFLRLYC